jgi:hypothetical protein
MTVPVAPTQTTANIAVKTGVKILCFGPPGAGKTRMIATLPNPYIFSAEGGLLSLSDKNIPFWQIQNIGDFRQAWAWITGSAESRKYESFAIDSVSEIAENCLTFQKTQSRDGRKNYGDMAEEVAKIVKDFRKLIGPNVYFSAKQAVIKNEGAIPPSYAGIMMPGNQLHQSIPFEFDEVFQLVPAKTPEGQRYSMLRTAGAHEFDIVKDRSGQLAEWEAPDLGAIINKITKGK